MYAYSIWYFIVSKVQKNHYKNSFKSLTSGPAARAKVTPRAIKATKSLIICLRHGMHWILKYMCGQNMTD